MQAGATPPFLCPSDGRAKAHRSYIPRDPRVSSARTIQVSNRLNRINPSMSAGIGRFPAERLPLHKSLARAWAGPPCPYRNLCNPCCQSDLLPMLPVCTTQPTIPHHSSMKTKKADHPTGLFPLCPRAETQRSRCCSLSGTPSHSSASGNGSFFSVMFGQISASSAFSSVKCC